MGDPLGVQVVEPKGNFEGDLGDELFGERVPGEAGDLTPVAVLS